MDPRELLSLLTARVQRFHYAPGGIPNITADDIAHAMGRIQNEDARLLMRLKYTGETKLLHDMDIRLYLRAIGEFRYRGGLPKGEYMRAMCQMAIAEFMDDHLCAACGGQSAQTAEALRNVLKAEVCATCHDTGKVYPEEEDRAKAAGLDEEAWKNTAHVYRRIQGILWDLEANALGNLADLLAPENVV